MKFQHLVLTEVICPTCNGTGFLSGKPCHRCGGSGQEEALICETCGAPMEECDCFPQMDLPVWCRLDPSCQECPAPEEEIKDAIENLLSYCQSCPYAALTKKAA